MSFLVDAEMIFLSDYGSSFWSARESVSVLAPSTPIGTGLFSLFELKSAYSDGVIPTNLLAGLTSFRDL